MHIGIENISTRAKEKVLEQNQSLYISRDAHGIFWRSSNAKQQGQLAEAELQQTSAAAFEDVGQLTRLT